MPEVAVALFDPDSSPAATELAQHLKLPFVGSVDPRQHDLHSLLLGFIDGQLSAVPTGRDAPGAVSVDFVGGEMAHRRRFGGGRGQPIAKAIGLKPGITPQVLDATAGLGRDSFVLASLGCKVRMLERSPEVAALLQDGLRRAAFDREVAPIVARMQLVQADALTWLQQAASDSVDVLLLDPMFPHRDKSALVKKEMRIFRTLVGEDLDADALLQPALAVARYRVVVKRPRLAPFLAGQKPSLSLEGKSGRFDLYTKRSLDALKQETAAAD